MPKLILGVGVAVMVTLAAVALWLDKPAVKVASLKVPPAEKVDATAGAIYATRFVDLDGRDRSLGEWQHKLLVVNFWATWCAPCKEEMPIFTRLQEKFSSRGLQIIGIAADSRLNVANFSKSFSSGYPLLPDEARAIEFSRRLGNRLGLLPFTVALRPGGDVVFTRLGVITEAEMIELITKNTLN